MSKIQSSGENITINADGSGNDVLIQSNGSTKAIVTGEGNVGVGVTPETWTNTWKAVQVNETTCFAASPTALYVMENSYYNSGWKYITTSNASNYYQEGGAHHFRVAASGSADAAITWTTPLSIALDGNVTVGTGNLVIGTSGKGIDFSANSNAGGMTSELLDSYEEGAFTATLTGSSANPSTAVTTTGYYTKIGDVVQIGIEFSDKNTTGASGNVEVTGLPFTSKNVVSRYPVSTVFYNGFTWDSPRTAKMLVPANASFMYAYSDGSNSAWQQVGHNARSGVYLWVSGTYRAA